MGTKFNLKDPNPGAWFKFNEDDPKSGEISIRAVNAAKRREIQKKCIKQKVEYKHGQRFEFTESDDDLFSEMLWDYVIADWHDLEDDDGKPIECTKENKIFLMLNNVGFALFVNECLEKVNDDLENRIKKENEDLSKGSTASEKSRTAKSAKS
jgi:hypothetical protein